MVHKRFGILLMFVLLTLTPVYSSLADEYEGDNESYYDDQLAQLDTVTSGDWLYLVQADGTIALQRYQGNGVDVTVVDAEELGAGASTRSGGMVSSGQKLVIGGAIKGVVQRCWRS